MEPLHYVSSLIDHLLQGLTYLYSGLCIAQWKKQRRTNWSSLQSFWNSSLLKLFLTTPKCFLETRLVLDFFNLFTLLPPVLFLFLSVYSFVFTDTEHDSGPKAARELFERCSVKGGTCKRCRSTTTTQLWSEILVRMPWQVRFCVR